MIQLDCRFLSAYDVDQRFDRAVFKRFARVRLFYDRLAVGELLPIAVAEKTGDRRCRRLRRGFLRDIRCGRRFGRCGRRLVRRFCGLLRNDFFGRFRRDLFLRRQGCERDDLILPDLSDVQPVKRVGVDRHCKRAGNQHVRDQNTCQTLPGKAVPLERALAEQNQIQNPRRKYQRRNDQMQILRQREGRIDHIVQSRIEMIENVKHNVVGGQDPRQVGENRRNDAQSFVLRFRRFLHRVLRSLRFLSFSPDYNMNI